MRDYHVVSFSGGKDSTAMLLHMLELDMPVDEIIFCDTGMEFPAMYDHVDKVEAYIGRKITRLKSDKTFEYYLFEYTPKKLAEQGLQGKGFPSAHIRWCTNYLKTSQIDKFLRKHKNAVQYIGIAADEPKRIKGKKYPLVEWGWTEADALQYCYDKGFDWGGLYQHFNRVSCWCCPLQNLNSLRTLRHNFPDLWAKLLEWQTRTWRKFRADYSVQELEDKFAKEDEKNARYQQLLLDF